MGASPINPEVLTVADDFVFKSNSGRQFLQFANDTGGPVVITIVGDSAPTDLVCPGTAMISDLSGGYVINMADGDTVMLSTDSIKNYLIDSQNLPAINSDVPGVLAFLLEA